MATYRDAGPLLPLQGARVYELGHVGSRPLAATMGVWVVGGMGIPTLLSLFVGDGEPPLWLLPVTVLVVLGALAASFAVWRRLSARSRWRLHVGSGRRVLERLDGDAATFDLATLPLRAGGHEYSTRYGKGGMSTLTIELPGQTLVLTGPLGHGMYDPSAREFAVSVGDGVPPAPSLSSAPSLRLDDAREFDALLASARAA